MAQGDRLIPEKERCSTCSGSGWSWWSAGIAPAENGKWVVCRACIGTGRTDQNGRKRLKPDEEPDG